MFATCTDRGNSLHRKVFIQKKLQNDKENTTYVFWEECLKTKSQAKLMQIAYSLVQAVGRASFHPTKHCTTLPHKTQKPN